MLRLRNIRVSVCVCVCDTVWVDFGVELSAVILCTLHCGGLLSVGLWVLFIRDHCLSKHGVVTHSEQEKPTGS